MKFLDKLLNKPIENPQNKASEADVPKVEETEQTKREKRISFLSKTKVNMERNASLCAVVLALLCYNTWTAHSNDDPKVWFYIVMGLFMLICVGIIAYDLVTSYKAKKELEVLRKELEEEQSE